MLQRNNFFLLLRDSSASLFAHGTPVVIFLGKNSIDNASQGPVHRTCKHTMGLGITEWQIIRHVSPEIIFFGEGGGGKNNASPLLLKSS